MQQFMNRDLRESSPLDLICWDIQLQHASTSISFYPCLHVTSDIPSHPISIVLELNARHVSGTRRYRSDKSGVCSGVTLAKPPAISTQIT
ncbi:hypothetical protein RRG08_019979 [Elysia crispata]|uniref:Uncharacterized protein n=1 Tax=Elysia crispata TaxID=231223 RepID=A0AAE1BB59_9GAST|nr:hypothetical protein RRG08_019979 [Elysia crispata]